MLTFHLDQRGSARAETPPGMEMLGDFFIEDIQRSRRHCNEVIEIATEVKEGKRVQWEGTGNAHKLTIRPSGVVIENEWDESLGQCNITIGEFCEAASDWLAFIEAVERKRER